MALGNLWRSFGNLWADPSSTRTASQSDVELYGTVIGATEINRLHPRRDMAIVRVSGALNRVIIVEFGGSATRVGVMLALPLVFVPLRAQVGSRHDTYVSFLGWQRHTLLKLPEP